MKPYAIAPGFALILAGAGVAIAAPAIHAAPVLQAPPIGTRFQQQITPFRIRRFHERGVKPAATSEPCEVVQLPLLATPPPGIHRKVCPELVPSPLPPLE